MFTCDKCNVDRIFDHTDYYDFDIYVCPKCGSQMAFPADGYGEPDDEDDEEYFDEPGEDDDFLWFEPDDEDWEAYDYTEGDPGQDGEI